MDRIFLSGFLVFMLASCAGPSVEKQNATIEDTKVVQGYVDLEHTSENSVDWEGIYDGTIPCADCEGIKTSIELREDGTFDIQSEYLEKELKLVDKGKFTWYDNGSKIVLKGEQTDLRLKVGENKLFQLDQDGSLVTGDLAEKYIYKKRV